MPIDRTVFTREFTLLLERFGKDPHQLMTARYFEYLDARLTTPQFEQAARIIFAEDQFWPAPIRFIHAAKGDPHQLARQEWDELLTAAAQGQLANLSPAGQRALRAVGGWRSIAFAQDGALPTLRRAFLDSFTTNDTNPQRPQLEGATDH